jgi:hypothetical protein
LLTCPFFSSLSLIPTLDPVCKAGPLMHLPSWYVPIFHYHRGVSLSMRVSRALFRLVMGISRQMRAYMAQFFILTNIRPMS